MFKKAAYPYNTNNGKDFLFENFGLRFHFNGKENDNVTQTQDYGFRIYNGRLGRFLSVDPLTKSFPMLTPYQFASNSPISGIDLDGLEYLDANKARIELRNGVVMLKLSNFLVSSIPLDNHNNSNWTGNGIGTSIIVGELNLAPKPPTSNQIPGNHLPTQSQGQTESGVQSKVGKYGKTNSGMVDVKGQPNKGIGKAAMYLDVVMVGIDIASIAGSSYDQTLVQKQSLLIQKVENNIQDALNSNMIPPKYQNEDNLSSIMNVVLQGESNSNDPEIYKIGMDIYNKYNPPLQIITDVSGLDNYPDTKVVVPRNLKPSDEKK